MRKKAGWCIGILLLLVCCMMRCFDAEGIVETSGNDSDIQQTSGQLSYSKLKKMEQISMEGNIVTVVLEQDGALPYRWAVSKQSECVVLAEEYEVEDPGNDSLFSVGVAPEYHVFVFELSEAEQAEILLHNLWVVEPENLSKANGIYFVNLECTDNQWKIIME